MCKWSRFTEGETVTLIVNPPATCDHCGSDLDIHVSAVYMGHRVDKRYGYVDRFAFNIPIKCEECGNRVTEWIDPCGGISSSLFDTVRQQEEVHRQ